MKQHVVCCGLPIPESRRLYDALRPSFVATVKSPELNMAAEKAIVPTKHILTHRPEDIFVAARIAEFCTLNEKRLKLVIIVSDLKQVLSLRDTAFPHQHSMSWDHAIERNANGIPSFTAAGVAPYATAILSAIADERLETLVVRSEDLLADPGREWMRIEAFTGIELSGEAASAALLDTRESTSDPVSPSVSSSQGQADLAHAMHAFRLAPALTDFMRRFGYEDVGQWDGEMSGVASNPLNDTPGTIIGFYTHGNIYEQEARRLEVSVRKLGLPIHIEAIPDQGSWLANVRVKPSILENLRRRFDGPLLYVDVDAVLHANPWPALRGYQQDAAYCVMRDGHARSGTVLINDSPGARSFLAEWKDRLDVRSEDWDQFPLNDMLTAGAGPTTTGYTIGLLPVSMCYVFDRDKAKLCSPPAVPVIEHLAASRENDERLSVDGGLARLERRRRRLTELGG